MVLVLYRKNPFLQRQIPVLLSFRSFARFAVLGSPVFRLSLPDLPFRDSCISRDTLPGLSHVRVFIHSPLLERPCSKSHFFQLLFCYFEDRDFGFPYASEVLIHNFFHPFTVVIGRSLVSRSAGFSVPGIVTILSLFARYCWWI